MGRNGIEIGKASVVNLLSPAGDVQFNRFHQFRIAEIGNRKIVKGNVPVFTDAETDNVYWTLLE